MQTVTVTELNNQAVNDVTTYTYDLDGNLHTTVTNTGSATLTATSTYDDLDRPLTLVNTGTSGTVISSYSYYRNAMGDVTEVDEVAPDGSSRQVNYQYDTLERLTEEKVTVGGAVTSQTDYAYDLVGNRLTQTTVVGTTTSTTTFSYNDDDQLWRQVAPDGADTRNYYDFNGSLTSTTVNGTVTASYTYDSRNRLVSATVNGQPESFTYDDDANRIASAAASGTTVYVNDEQSPTGYTQVLAEKKGADGTVEAAYAYGLQLIAQARPATGTSVYLFDGHGNVRALASTSGAVTDTYVYDAFGNLTASTGTTSNVYRYTAQRFDSILGEYDLRARDYDPSTGRYTTMDDPRLLGGPGDLGNANLYVYVGGNPLNATDPSGRDLVATLGAVGIMSLLSGAFGLVAGVAAHHSIRGAIAGFASGFASTSTALLLLPELGAVMGPFAIPISWGIGSAVGKVVEISILEGVEKLEETKSLVEITASFITGALLGGIGGVGGDAAQSLKIELEEIVETRSDVWRVLGQVQSKTGVLPRAVAESDLTQNVSTVLKLWWPEVKDVLKEAFVDDTKDVLKEALVEPAALFVVSFVKSILGVGKTSSATEG